MGTMERLAMVARNLNTTVRVECDPNRTDGTRCFVSLVTGSGYEIMAGGGYTVLEAALKCCENAQIALNPIRGLGPKEET